MCFLAVVRKKLNCCWCLPAEGGVQEPFPGALVRGAQHGRAEPLPAGRGGHAVRQEQEGLIPRLDQLLESDTQHPEQTA